LIEQCNLNTKEFLMATYTKQYPGNTALQTEAWTLSLAEAAAVLPLLDVRKGTYWEASLLKPLRRAKRAKASAVRVYTAGFSTSELSNVLYASGATIQR
jgi:hypothetical protein